MLKLIHIDSKPGGKHATFRVEDDAVEIIGRQAPRLHLPDTRVSREHAEVSVQNRAWVIRDLGSANGTLVNGRAISGLCELEDDDIIQIGRIKLIVAVARVESTTAHTVAEPRPDDTAATGETAGLGPTDAVMADDTGIGAAHDEDNSPPEEFAEDEPTGLRLANYDVLADDELAEVLAADAPPSVPHAEAPVPIELPDHEDTPALDEELLLDIEPDAEANFGAAVDPPTPPEVASDPNPLADPLDAPRRGAASADSRLVTPAPESALGAYPEAHGFPWRGTAAAVLTLATVGTAAVLLSRGVLTGPLVPVTGTQQTPTLPKVAPDSASAPVASAATTRAPARRGQPSPFDAGPLLTAPTTPRKPAPTRQPAHVAPPAPKPEPQPQRATPTPTPQPGKSEPAPAEAVTPAPAPPAAPPPPALKETSPAPTPRESVAAATNSRPEAGPSTAVPVVTTEMLTGLTPRPTAPLLPDATPKPSIAPQLDTGAATPAAPLSAPRRVVYVVDASGSMVDSMNQGVLTWLETQVGSLRPTDAFSVIFFHDDEVLETPPAGLKSGRRAEQVKALDWMAPESGNMRPRGRSRPLAALRLAASYGPAEVVLLTDDNFGMRSGEDISPKALAEVLRPSGPDTTMPTVHAVQFFYEGSKSRLKDIASLFGGRYQFVEEPPFDARPVLDELLDG